MNDARVPPPDAADPLPWLQPLAPPPAARRAAFHALVCEFNLRPDRYLHVTRVPDDWPARYRSPDAFGAAGRKLLARHLLAVHGVAGRHDFDVANACARVALLPGAALEQLAAYAGLLLHRGWLRDALTVRRIRAEVAAKLGGDALTLALERAPEFGALADTLEPWRAEPAMLPAVIRARRAAAGRLHRRGRRRRCTPRAAQVQPRDRRRSAVLAQSRAARPVRRTAVPVSDSREACVMGLAFLITSDNLQLLSERKVLKEREYAALLDASAVIATARDEAQRIVADAQREFERRHAAGYEEGMRRAQREQAAQTYAQALAAARTMESMKDAMAEIVVKAVRAIVGEMSTQKLYEAALARIAPLVRDEAFVTVRVAPGRSDEMRDALERAFAAQTNRQKIRIVEDAQLARDACAVETPSGRIHASLDLQIDALRQAIRRDASLGAAR